MTSVQAAVLTRRWPLLLTPGKAALYLVLDAAERRALYDVARRVQEKPVGERTGCEQLVLLYAQNLGQRQPCFRGEFGYRGTACAPARSAPRPRRRSPVLPASAPAQKGLR